MPDKLRLKKSLIGERARPRDRARVDQEPRPEFPADGVSLYGLCLLFFQIPQRVPFLFRRMIRSPPNSLRKRRGSSTLTHDGLLAPFRKRERAQPFNKESVGREVHSASGRAYHRRTPVLCPRAGTSSGVTEHCHSSVRSLSIRRHSPRLIRSSARCS